MFAFHNRKRNQVKLLSYERTCFRPMLRRLEKDHFVWARRQQAVIKLTTEQSHRLLDDIDIDTVRRHPIRAYSHASGTPGVAGKQRLAGSSQIPVNPTRAALRHLGGMNEDGLSRLRAAAQAYIRETRGARPELGERNARLEEQFRLAQSKRFAPRARSSAIAASTRLNRPPPPNPAITPAVPKAHTRCPCRPTRWTRNGAGENTSRCRRTCHAAH
jgi:hypothetical protein